MNIMIKNGMVIKLDENSDKKYIIIEHIKKEKKIYMLVTDFEGEINLEEQLVKNMKIDYSKIFMISYNQETNEFIYDKDKEMIDFLIAKSLNN